MARPTNYVTRSELDWPSTGASWANPSSGLVVHYDSTNMDLAGKSHTECIAYWHRTRRFHTGPARGWADIGYSFFACPHGYVLEGRGLNRQQAAQPGGNATHYSVTLAGGPSDTITKNQINAVRETRLWLMEDHNNSGTVLGHRDFTNTSCPGNKAYALVQDGTFTKAPGAFTTGDDMSFVGLSKGDKGQLVRDFQKYLEDCEYPPANSFANGEWDGIFGDGVEQALVDLRRDNGSSVTSSPHVSYWAMNQCRRAHWKAMYKRYRDPSGDSDDGSLPTEEDITITGTLKRG